MLCGSFCFAFRLVNFDLEQRLAGDFGTQPECAVHLPFILLFFLDVFLTADYDKSSMELGRNWGLVVNDQ